MKHTLQILLNELRLSFTVVLIFFATSLSAQQRYFAVSLVNENDDDQLDLIQSAKDVGCNAVSLTIQWGTIEGKISRILKQENGDDYNVWKQYDDQIALALSLGMKVGLNIAVSTGDDATNSSSDRFGINTGDGWLKEDRMVVYNYAGEGAVFQKQGGPIRPGVNLQFVMTSLVAESTRNRIINFSKKVIGHYQDLNSALLNNNNLLYVNLIFSRNGEGEFEIGSTKYHYNQRLDMDAALTDYSEPMVAGYKAWLTGKYGHIVYLNSKWGSNYASFNEIFPKLPSGSTFTGADGTDWFLYRTAVLKETNNIFKDAVKSVDPGIKVITHHGSVFDKISRARGTLPFNQIGADLDGIKINDDEHYDHRFALDLVRTNLPGKIYINESAYIDGIGFTEELAEESYKHGANVVTVFHMENALQVPSAVTALKALTNKWVKNKEVTVPVATNNDNFNLSSSIAVDGCETNRDNYSNDCDAYKKWRNAYNNAGNKPVNIYMIDDVTTPGCFYKDLKASANDDQAAAIIPNNEYYHLTSDNCRLVGTVKGNNLTNGTTPFSGSVTIDDEVNSYKNQPYVQRHFEFKPGGTNPNQARLTLYVKQSEFTAFNAASSVKLPRNTADPDGGKAKLRIWQWHGNKALTGNPDDVIDPADSDIQWDSVLGLWRISFNVTGFSSFFVTAENAVPLPVTLVSFTGEKVENAVSLRWKTSEETNSDHFEVQHSTNGKQWAAIGNVASSGESTVTKNYDFTHQNPVAGENLYRLKMIDLDSSYAYSKLVSVVFETENQLTVYPNPASSGEIRVAYSGAVPDLKVADVNGRVITIDAEQKEKNLITIKSSALAAGLYVLTADYGNKQLKYKVLVVR